MIEVNTNRDPDDDLGYEHFVPENPFAKKLLKRFPFPDGKSNDVVFRV